MIRQRAQSERPSPAGVLRALWSYRRLVGSLVRRDLAKRASGAVWGHAWLVLQPAVQIAIYTVIFGAVIGARLPGVDDRLAYGLFLCAGVIHWTWFADLLAGVQSMFLEHAEIVKALRVPRSILPVAVFLSSAVNYAITAGIFLGVLAVLGRWPGTLLLAALPLLALQSLLAVALGVLSGTVNVFFRDVGKATPMVLQIWFWLTPIVYPASILPEPVRAALPWNPLFATMVGYQRIVIDRQAPSWPDLIGPSLVAAGLGALAWAVFRRLSADVVDEL
jgi:lipopolysaccharide transport system permease protein